MTQPFIDYAHPLPGRTIKIKGIEYLAPCLFLVEKTPKNSKSRFSLEGVKRSAWIYGDSMQFNLRLKLDGKEYFAPTIYQLKVSESAALQHQIDFLQNQLNSLSDKA